MSFASSNSFHHILSFFPYAFLFSLFILSYRSFSFYILLLALRAPAGRDKENIKKERAIRENKGKGKGIGRKEYYQELRQL